MISLTADTRTSSELLLFEEKWHKGLALVTWEGETVMLRNPLPASLTKLISNFQILHAELGELPPYRFSLNAKTCRCTWSWSFLLFPSQQLRSNEQSLSFHIWGNIFILASDPGICGGTVHCYSTKDVSLQKMTRFVPAGTEEAAASSTNSLRSSEPTPSSNKLKEISKWLLKVLYRANCVSFLLLYDNSMEASFWVGVQHLVQSCHDTGNSF